MQAFKKGLKGRKAGPGAEELLSVPVPADEKEWRDSLQRDARLLKSAEAFCRDVVSAIDAMSQSSAKFWEELQDLEAAGLQIAEDSALVMHLWALRSGLQLIVPSVTKELQKASKKLKELSHRNRKWTEVCSMKDARWREKVHYDAKLGELLKKKSDKQDLGKSLTGDENSHLMRNLAKHEAACEQYTQVSDAVQTAMRKQKLETVEDRSGQGATTKGKSFGGDVELRRLLRDVVRSVSCGWLISCGAAVCQAINQAEAESTGRAEFQTQRRPPQRGMLMLPKSMEEATFEPARGFDPKASLHEPWRHSTVTVEEIDESAGPSPTHHDEFAFVDGLQTVFESDSEAGDDPWASSRAGSPHLSCKDPPLEEKPQTESEAAAPPPPPPPEDWPSCSKPAAACAAAASASDAIPLPGPQAQTEAPRTESAETAESAGSFWSFVDAGAFGSDVLVHKDQDEKEPDPKKVASSTNAAEEMSVAELRQQLLSLGYDVPAGAAGDGMGMDREELLRVLQAVTD